MNTTAAQATPAPKYIVEKIKDTNDGGAIYKVQGFPEWHIKISQDSDGTHPRTEYDNAGTLLFWNRNYNLSDTGKGRTATHDFTGDHEDFIRAAKASNWEVLQVDLYEGSYIYLQSREIDIRKSIIEFPADQYTGFIFITPAKGREEWGRNWREKARNCMKAEVQEYSDYLQGNVYGYQVFRGKEDVESCCGFIGDYDQDGGCLSEAVNSLVSCAENYTPKPKKWQLVAASALLSFPISKEEREAVNPMKYTNFEDWIKDTKI